MGVLATYGRMIRFSHTLFAMPFALASAWVASRTVPTSARTWLLIALCMVLARTAAMGFNRIVDRDVDAQNPRTATRELVTGAIGLRAAWTLTAASALGFVAAAVALHPLCGKLSPVAIAVTLGYSLGKRFTALVHLWLGAALGLAPIAAWLAVTGEFAWPPVVLAAAVATWVAGFDILYSLQDEDFDRRAGLRSIPARLGQVPALWISGALHALTAAFLVAFGALVPLGWPYAVGCALVVGVLGYEHWIVRPGDLSRIDKAFFDLNGYVSMIFLGAVLAAA